MITKKRIRDPEKMKVYRDKYRDNNRQMCRDSQNNWRKKKLKAEPWYRLFIGVCTRCCYTKHHYYKKGIKKFISPEDVKYMWFRDKAYMLDRPSIDRIDNDGDYTLENCRMVELEENLRNRHGNKQENIEIEIAYS